MPVPSIIHAKKKKVPFWVNFKSLFLDRWASQNQDFSKLFCRKWDIARDTQPVPDWRRGTRLSYGDPSFQTAWVGMAPWTKVFASWAESLTDGIPINHHILHSGTEIQTTSSHFCSNISPTGAVPHPISKPAVRASCPGCPGGPQTPPHLP